MGRTVPPYRVMLEEELKRWKRFRDVLRIDERKIFDDMADECRRYASAAGATCLPDLADAMFLTILFAHHKTIKELDRKTKLVGSKFPITEEHLTSP